MELVRVFDRTFYGERFVIDGKHIRGCRFDRCEVVSESKCNYPAIVENCELRECTIGGVPFPRTTRTK
jgi:hypothetical protein